MAISERAQNVHDELFGDHHSTLPMTDPELIEYFDNFAFDEVLQHSKLPATTRLMVQLAAMIACQALREYRVLLGAALRVGVSPVAIKEIVYQAVPYCGMGRVYDVIHVGNDRAVPIDVLTQLVPFIGYPRMLNGLRMINETAPYRAAN